MEFAFWTTSPVHDFESLVKKPQYGRPTLARSLRGGIVRGDPRSEATEGLSGPSCACQSKNDHGGRADMASECDVTAPGPGPGDHWKFA